LDIKGELILNLLREARVSGKIATRLPTGGKIANRGKLAILQPCQKEKELQNLE
jgi:hypothetical protein